MVAHDRVEENREAGARRENFVLTILCALLLFVHWGLRDFNPQAYGTAAIDGAEVELFAPSGGSPVMVLGVGALLLFGRRRELIEALGRAPLWSAGTAMLALGAVIQRWADYVHAPELLVVSLILLLLGSAALIAGPVGLRAIAAPSLLLLFAFPIPSVLVNILIWPLQLHTAASATWFLRWIGFSPETNADMIVLGGNAFQVIETCSGMRMIETLIMAACLYSLLFYRRRSQVVILILAAPLIGYFVNFVRVLSIIFNPYAKWATVHTTQGIVMLVVGVLMLAGLDSLLQRWQPARSATRRSKSVPLPSASDFRWGGVAAVALVLLVLTLANLALPRWQAKETPAPKAFGLPGVLAGSKPTPLKLDREFLGSVGVSNWLNRQYDFQDSQVQIRVLADERLHRSGSLVSSKTSVPGRGFVEVSRSEVALFPDVYVRRHLYQTPNQQVLVYHWTEGIRGVLEEALRDALVLDRGPTRRNSFALSIRLSTFVAPESQGGEKADRRLGDFAAVLRDALE